MIRTLTESLTTRSLTGESTERTRRVTSTGSLIDHIRTEILTVGTKIQRGSGMLKVRNIELRINIVRITRSTCQSEVKPALNMALSGNIAERNRLTVSIKINLDLRILITRSSQPRLKIVRRQTTLENRSARTKPRPRTERRITNGILSSPLTNSSRRIRSTLNVIQKSTQRRNKILNVTLFLRTDIKRRSKRSGGESLNLLIHIIMIENIEDTQHFQSRKLIAIIRIGNNIISRYQTNRKTTIISQRTRLNNITRNQSCSTSSTCFGIKNKGNTTSTPTAICVNLRKLDIVRIVRNTGIIHKEIPIIKTIRNKEIFQAKLETINQRSVHRHSLNECGRFKTKIIASENARKRDRNKVTRRKGSRRNMRKIHVRLLVSAAG